MIEKITIITEHIKIHLFISKISRFYNAFLIKLKPTVFSNNPFLSLSSFRSSIYGKNVSRYETLTDQNCSKRFKKKYCFLNNPFLCALAIAEFFGP